MAVLLRRHWYVRGAVPAATTLKVAACPLVTLWSAGWLVIVGLAVTVTVSFADRLVNQHGDRFEPGGASQDRGGEPMVRAESASRDEGARTTLERVADHKLELARLVPAVGQTRALIALHVQPGPGKPSAIELQRADRGGRLHEWGSRKLLLRGGICPKQREIRIGHGPLSHDLDRDAIREIRL